MTDTTLADRLSANYRAPGVHAFQDAVGVVRILERDLAEANRRLSEGVIVQANQALRIERLEKALRHIAISEDADCRHAHDWARMTEIAREALK